MNPRELPPRLAATLAKGLDENSRVMRKLSGNPPMELVLQARIIDELRVLQWMLGGAKKHNAPESIAVKMFGAPKTRKASSKGYNSGAEFDKAWKELTGNVRRNDAGQGVGTDCTVR